MAVERRIYWLRHLVLIAVVIIVLFPMVWLVSTSIRRDQAAFSSNLFSSRVTLQHYRNLLLPERSVGRLILDLQSATYATGDYRGKSQEELKKNVESYLVKFDSLMEESQRMVSNIESGMASIEKDVVSKEKKILLEINEIRINDKELFENRLKQIGTFEEPQMAYAVGRILETTVPSLEGVYPFYVDLLGERAAPITEAMEDYRQKYESTLKYRDETLKALVGLEFENREEVIKSLNSIDKYISLSSVDYSEWRRVEWLRVINRYLREVESSLSETEASVLNQARTNLYDSFKAAGDAWEVILSSNEKVSQELSSLAGEAFGSDYYEYIEVRETLSGIENSIAELKKSLAVSESAVLELEDSFEIAIPTVISETRKLSALIPPFELVVSKGIESSNSISNAKLAGSLDGVLSAMEIIDLVNGQLADIKNVEELSSELSELSSKLSWFVDNREVLMKVSGNSEISKGADVINIALSNLSRVLPVLQTSVSDYIEVSKSAKEAKSRLQNLEIEKEKLLDTISSHEKEAKKAEETYAHALEAINIRSAMLHIDREILSMEEARNYVSSLTNLLNSYFKIKASVRYRTLFWYDDFVKASTEARDGTVLLKELISSMKVMKDDLASKIYNYIELRFLGTSITLDDFGKMQETYNTLFQQVNAKYQRASRLISDLIEKPTSYSESYAAELREVDKSLFRANQIWVQKESTYFYFVRWLLNSVIVALAVALISVTVAALAAYPFSRMRFRGRKQGLLALLLVQMFPSIMFMVALYALLQFLGSVIPFLGLNTLGGLIFLYSGGIAFNIWLIKGYYDTISNSLEEAAMIDGATKFQAFTRVILPLARPILAVVAILTFMNIFNEYLIARIILQDMNKWTYAVGLWQFSGRFETSWGPFTAAALIGAVPMVIFFLVLQEYIVGGLTQGGVKE
ncbi:MAG TPA: ABC transporter permease subunit [Mesotoga infera]|nr:ABC transporter permease subunit [Mesotoga infera]